MNINEAMENLEFELDSCLIRAKKINDSALIQGLLYCLETIEQWQDTTKGAKEL
jgi:Na+-transporting NADH:ubiquinone oxidoreductase subunit NqrB